MRSMTKTDTPAPQTNVKSPATGAPERIWAYSHTGSEWRDGQFRPYDCSSMFGEVQEYVRADLLQSLREQRSRARTRFNMDGTYDFLDDHPLPQTNTEGQS